MDMVPIASAVQLSAWARVVRARPAGARTRIIHALLRRLWQLTWAHAHMVFFVTRASALHLPPPQVANEGGDRPGWAPLPFDLAVTARNAILEIPLSIRIITRALRSWDARHCTIQMRHQGAEHRWTIPVFPFRPRTPASLRAGAFLWHTAGHCGSSALWATIDREELAAVAAMHRFLTLAREEAGL